MVDADETFKLGLTAVAATVRWEQETLSRSVAGGEGIASTAATGARTATATHASAVAAASNCARRCGASAAPGGRPAATGAAIRPGATRRRPTAGQHAGQGKTHKERTPHDVLEHARHSSNPDAAAGTGELPKKARGPREDCVPTMPDLRQRRRTGADPTRTLLR